MQKIIVLFLVYLLINIEHNAQLLKIDLVIDSSYSSFSHVNTISDDIQIILIGENHTYLDYNTLLEFRTFQYLHEYKNVNTIMFEFGEGFDYLVGNYIRQTDDSLAAENGEMIKTIFFKQQFGLYDSLRDYYKQQLSIGKPFKIISGDIDHNLDLGIIAMSEMLKFKKCNDSISEVCGAFLGLRDHYYNKFKKSKQQGETKMSSNEKSEFLKLNVNELKSMKELVLLYDERIGHFKDALGDDFESFNTIMESFKKGIKWFEYGSERNILKAYYRENLMYLKLLDYLRINPAEKIFAQYGRCHISDTAFNDECNYESFKSFAQRLKESPHIDLVNKVCLVPQFYVNGSNKNLNLKAEIAELMLGFPDIDKTKEEVYTYKVDSTGPLKKLFGIYENVIINTSFQNEEYLYGTANVNNKEKDEKKEIEDFWGYFQIEGYQSFHNYRFNSLNSRFTEQGFGEIKSPIITYGGGLSLYEPQFLYGHLGFEYWNPISIIRGDSSSLTMNGYTFNFRMGRTLFDNDIFQLVPYFGYSQSVVKLKEDTPLSVPSLVVGSFDEQLVFTNRAAQIDAGIDFKLHYKFLGLDVKTGYRLDVSERSWQTSSSQPIGIKTAFSGLYLSLGGSIVIGYY
jgi:hypothetical protein